MIAQKGIFIILSMIFFIKQISYGQNINKTKLNSLNPFISYYNFMDGSQKVIPIINFGNNFGIAYSRILKSKKWMLNISSSYFSIFYSGNRNNLKPGDIIARGNIYLNGTYFYNLFNNRLGNLYGGSGLSFRFGDELIHAYYYAWEEVNYSRILLDGGLRFALMEKINLFSNFVLDGQVSFTRYVYRYDKGDPGYYDYGGSTKNLLTYQLGLGYRFGKSTEAEKIARKGKRKNKIRKNSFELYAPICHFFDDTPTNWLFVDSYMLNKYDSTMNLTSSKIYREIPYTLGLQYSRTLKDKHAIRFSILGYAIYYGLYSNTKPGEVLKKNYLLFSTSYLYNLLNNKTKIQALGEINYRTGYEDIVTSNTFNPNWMVETKGLPLNDIGLSAGIRAEHSLPYHLFLSGETKYTRYVYRGSKGIDFNGGHKKATPNTFTIKLGLGYRF